MKNKNVQLKTLHCDGSVKILEYCVAHNNGSSTVDQKLTIEMLNGKWVARIAMDEFPAQDTAKAAAHKLGDWLVRLGQSINEENEQFESIEL